MKTSHWAVALIVLCALLSLSPSAFAQNTTPAYFEASILSKITEHRECTGVRFYNVVSPESGESSVMAIGIREDKSEISNIANRYLLFETASRDGSKYEKLTQRKAAEACQKVKDIGGTSFSASFSKEELAGLLSTASTAGLIVKQKKTESFVTFEAQSASLGEGTVAPLVNTQALASGEPCPTFCGNTFNYLHLE